MRMRCAESRNDIDYRASTGYWASVLVAPLTFITMLLAPLGAYAADVQLKANNVPEASHAPVIVFWVLAFFTILAAALAITRRNPVMAALFLVITLFCTGGLYLLLHATFLAAIQVLVYAGAVMVLFIFVVMSVGRYDREEFGFARGAISKLIGLGALALLGERILRALIVPTGADVLWLADRVQDVTSSGGAVGDVRYVGQSLFGKYLFPFEIIAIPLLIAIVAAVMITRRRSGADEIVDERTGEDGHSAIKEEAVQ